MGKDVDKHILLDYYLIRYISNIFTYYRIISFQSVYYHPAFLVGTYDIKPKTTHTMGLGHGL
jgi:hypothetical protein